MKPYTLEQQMARFGIPESEQGPHVTELRAVVQRKLAEGMIYQSGGSWDPDAFTLTHEQRARAMLAFDWAIQRHHSYRQKCFDPIMGFGWRSKDGLWRKYFYFQWRRLPAWIGDRFRQLGCKYRVWRDRGLVNPYA